MTFKSTNLMSNLTCQQLQEEGIPLSIPTTTAQTLRYIQTAYYLAMLPVGLTLNCFIIFIIVRFKKLHHINYFLALQVVIVDLANITIFFPTSAANTLANGSLFTGLCQALGMAVSFLFAARNLLMFVLVADRFCLVFMPFWYDIRRVRVVVAMTTVAWVVSLVHVLIPVRGLLDCYAFSRTTWTCLIEDGCRYVAACRAYRALWLSLFTGGICVAFLFYLVLMCKARKLQNKVVVVKAKETEEIAARNRKIERRANTTFLLLLTTLVGVLVPLSFFFIIGGAVLNALEMDEPPAFTACAVAMLNIYYLIFVLDPVVMMRNQDVGEVMKTIKERIWRKEGRGIYTHNNTCNSH